jgi:hypothetical protein
MDATLGGLPLTAVDGFGVRWSIDQKGVQGWDSSDSTLSPKRKPRQAGAWGGLSYVPEDPIVMAGSCVAPSELAAAVALDRLKAAVSLGETTLTVTRAGSSRWATVRRDGAVLPHWVTPYSFDWSVQVVALDPRKFGTPLTASTGLPATTGGLVLPIVLPFTLGSTVVSGQASLTNLGNISGPVTLRIDGPVTGPVITHVGTGLRLVFSASLALLAGEWLTVSMEARTAMANDQANRANWITSRGWSSFEPGANTWAFTAQSYTAGAKLTITATPAWQ